MRSIAILFLSFCWLYELQGQDTVYNSIDTIICSPSSNEIFFQTPYDTASFSTAWYNFELDTVFSTSDRVSIVGYDSLLLISVSSDSLEYVKFDTIHFTLRVYPVLKYGIPAFKCYVGDTLFIEEKSIVDYSYTNVNYQSTSGSTLAIRDTFIYSFIGNGDTVGIYATYDIPECSVTFDTTLFLTTKLQPSALFDLEKTCENEFLRILNQSSSFTNSASYEFVIEY